MCYSMFEKLSDRIILMLIVADKKGKHMLCVYIQLIHTMYNENGNLIEANKNSQISVEGGRFIDKVLVDWGP